MCSEPGAPRRPPAPDGVARELGLSCQVSGSGPWALPPLQVFGGARGLRLATPTLSASSSSLDSVRTEGGFEGVRDGLPLKVAAWWSAPTERSGSGPSRPWAASILRVGAGTASRPPDSPGQRRRL